ncbi:MAG TPA: potassium transporter, partial [Pyrodictiaceae archaeon]|nr:potassium transporter [Pyrodictiaceae archaeon]
FLAGMILSETKYKYQIEANLVPFRDLLLGIFFGLVGREALGRMFVGVWFSGFIIWSALKG